MFDKILVSPMSRTGVFLGKSLAEISRIVAQIVIIIGLGWLLGARYATGIPGIVGILIIGIIFSLWFTAFSNIVALVTRDQESTIIGANILQFPLLFVSSAFLPLSVMPGWIQTVAMFNPSPTASTPPARSRSARDVMTVIEVTRFRRHLGHAGPGTDHPGRPRHRPGRRRRRDAQPRGEVGRAVTRHPGPTGPVASCRGPATD